VDLAVHKEKKKGDDTGFLPDKKKFRIGMGR
jgi:hypothetical protein